MKTGFTNIHSARTTVLVLWSLLLSLLPCHPDSTPSSPTPSPTESAYRQARSSWDASPTNITLGVHCARTAFDWADTQPSNPERARIAQLGIEIAQGILLQDPTSAGAHYYLALNLGQLARTRSLTALKLVSRMETSLLTARSLDETFDHAGPDRTLGILYQDAPGWPTSIGSRGKARKHLERALHLNPTYPGNRLAWVEALTAWRDRSNALTELALLDAEWPKARKSFSGSQWESDWIEWSQRRDAVAKRLGLPPAPPPAP